MQYCEYYDEFLSILNEELVPALGCTEPIAIAYAAAIAKSHLKHDVIGVDIHASGNILKNAKGVVVPNTRNLRGVRASAILGMLAGDPDLKLEVLSRVEEADIEKTVELLATDFAKSHLKDTKAKLYIEIIMRSVDEESKVVIMHTHTNVTFISYNGHVLFEKEMNERDFNTPLTTREHLALDKIYNFTQSVKMEDVKGKILQQISMNQSISMDGLSKDYGLAVGRTLLKHGSEEDIVLKAKAYAAAGSDARMSGSVMPVMTNSGSGNQGITTCLPVLVYALENQLSEEMLIRALVLSNLTAIHIKTNLGRLSAFCGVIPAGVGAACGLTYLMGGTQVQIKYTVDNMLGNISGMFCDGAKPSCASKIASSVDAAFQASFLALDDKVIEHDTGIIGDDVEMTIGNVGKIASEAMNEIDQMIVKIMTTHERGC